jgi:hypothetical protein
MHEAWANAGARARLAGRNALFRITPQDQPHHVDERERTYKAEVGGSKPPAPTVNLHALRQSVGSPSGLREQNIEPFSDGLVPSREQVRVPGRGDDGSVAQASGDLVMVVPGSVGAMDAAECRSPWKMTIGNVHVPGQESAGMLQGR